MAPADCRRHHAYRAARRALVRRETAEQRGDVVPKLAEFPAL